MLSSFITSFFIENCHLYTLLKWQHFHSPKYPLTELFFCLKRTCFICPALLLLLFTNLGISFSQEKYLVFNDRKWMRRKQIQQESNDRIAHLAHRHDGDEFSRIFFFSFNLCTKALNFICIVEYQVNVVLLLSFFALLFEVVFSYNFLL